MFSNRKFEKNCQILASCREKYYKFKYIKCADFEIKLLIAADKSELGSNG